MFAADKIYWLALLAYVSRAHANRNLSIVRRPSLRVAIISERNARMFFKFWLLLPQALLLLQIAPESVQTFPECLSLWSSQNNVWDFGNFENFNFLTTRDFDSTQWEWKFQTANPPRLQITAKVFISNLSWISPQIVLTKLRWGFWHFWSFRFLTILFSKI